MNWKIEILVSEQATTFTILSLQYIVVVLWRRTRDTNLDLESIFFMIIKRSWLLFTWVTQFLVYFFTWVKKFCVTFFTQVFITVQYFERVCKDILELPAHVSLCNGENEVRIGWCFHVVTRLLQLCTVLVSDVLRVFLSDLCLNDSHQTYPGLISNDTSPVRLIDSTWRHGCLYTPER